MPAPPLLPPTSPLSPLPPNQPEQAGPTPATNNGYYVWTGAFLNVAGAVLRSGVQATVVAPAPRGSHVLQTADASKLHPGDSVTLWLSGGAGALAWEM